MAIGGYRRLTEADQAELDKLNQAVKNAIDARTAWLDNRMRFYADVQVGDMLYNLKTFDCLGKVTRHYRYFATQNRLHDTALEICYEYVTSAGIHDNTSRQPSLIVGSYEEARRRLQSMADNL